MNDFDLRQKYTAKRDFTSSGSDRYAQELETMFFHLRAKLFPILEKGINWGKSWHPKR